MRLKHWFYTAPLRLRSLFRRAQVEQELDEEIRYHIERQIEEHISKGMTEEEARYAALRAMGGVERRKEECRDMRRVRLIEDLLQDLRYGLRTLRKSPSFTIVAIITLALGIGANTAIFSVVNAVLLRPLPCEDPDRLVVFWAAHPQVGREVASLPDFVDWREQSRSFERMAAFTDRAFNLTGVGEAERLNGQVITSDLFPALSTPLAFGRSFLPEEDRPGVSGVVILSCGLCVSLMVKSLYRLLNLDAGFNRENLLTMQISLPQMKYGSDQQVDAFYQRLIEGVRGAPGVVSATAVSPLPLSGMGSNLAFGIAGRLAGAPDAGGDANVLSVRDRYIETMRVPLLLGRPLTEQDGQGGPKATLINQTFARRYFDGQNPIGHQVTFDVPQTTSAIS